MTGHVTVKLIFMKSRGLVYDMNNKTISQIRNKNYGSFSHIYGHQGKGKMDHKRKETIPSLGCKLNYSFGKVKRVCLTKIWDKSSKFMKRVVNN